MGNVCFYSTHQSINTFYSYTFITYQPILKQMRVIQSNVSQIKTDITVYLQESSQDPSSYLYQWYGND